ncbi:MAG: MFS transporter [Gemmataceae bacterium]|nr:MFS transporter [Gemmataceae bacterium]
MSDPAAPEKTPLPLRARLSGLMFLQYFIQGSYLPIAAVYLLHGLGFSGDDVGFFIAALAVGPLVAPFIVGQLVDRYLATERVLAFCHLVAGGLMLALYVQADFWPVFALGLAYSILYVPTLMLANALCLHHLHREEREFPLVRLWGTIGFVVPAFLIELVFLAGLTGPALATGRGVAFLVAGVAEVLLALYCLTLPHTPPGKSEAAARFAPGEVLRLLSRRDFLILVLSGLLAAVCHSFHLQWNSPYLRWFLTAVGIEGALEQRLSTIGQFCEIPVMAALGLALSWLGFKWVLALGVLAYLGRCLLFAAVAHYELAFEEAMLLVGMGQALHGFCVACFWAAGFLYVDRVAGPALRGSMQTFFGTFVFGLGMLLGGLGIRLVALLVGGQADRATGADWAVMWLVPAMVAATALVGFVTLFPRPPRATSISERGG